MPSCSQAWGPVGHKTVAMIAQSRLNSVTLSNIRALVGSYVDLDWLANCPDVFDHGDASFNCAGKILMDGDPQKSRRWHYIDIPLSENLDPGAWQDFCGEETSCVLEQIQKDFALLRNPDGDSHERRLALVYLIHFVGDAHQPLHCVNDQDDGGNDKPVDVLKARSDSETLNLHQIWDHVISNASPQRLPNGPNPIYIESKKLAEMLEGELSNPAVFSNAEIASWTEGDFTGRMAFESFQLAKTVIYPDYSRDLGRIADASSPHKIGSEYQDRMRPIAYRRIEMAGVRLAFLLNEALGPASEMPRNPILSSPALQKNIRKIERLDPKYGF